MAACRIKYGLQNCLYIGNLDSKRDWGHAKDYVEMQWLMLQQEIPKDYVIATGEQISVREFMVRVFKLLGIDLIWRGKGIEEVGIWLDHSNDIVSEKIVVRVDKSYFRPTEVETLLGDISKAKAELNWKPRIKIDQLIKEMVENDEKQAKEELALLNIREK